MKFENLYNFFHKGISVGSLKCSYGLIITSMLSILFFVLSYLISYIFMGLFGILFVAVSIMVKGIKGGLLASSYITLLYIIVYLMSDGEMNMIHMLSSLLVFFGMAVFMGAGIETRNKIQRKLEASKNYLAVTLYSIGDAVISTDRDGRVTQMNAVAEELTAWKIDDALGRDLSELFSIVNGDSRQPIENPVAAVLESGEKISQEENTILINENNQEFQINDCAAPIKDEKGEIFGVVLVFRDVTEKHKKEEMLKKSEEKYSTLVEKAPIGIFRTNSEGSPLTINSALVDILGGKSAEEIINYYQNLEEDLYLHSEDRQRFIGTIKKDGEVKKFQYQAKRIDGTVIWLEMDARISETFSDGIFHIDGFVSDITERKKSEEKIKYMSFHDGLTGLYSRHYMEEEMRRIDSKRQLPISMIMGDLNGLKLINDTYGHQKGDFLLKKTADILRSSCRQEDMLSRWGGDEFVILLPSTTGKEAHKIYTRIKDKCEATTQDQFPISIALGVAVKEDINQDIAKVLKRAEDNMYKNKLIEKRSAKNNILKALLSTLKEKSHETEEHNQRIIEMATILGEAIGLSHSDLNKLAIIANLHDIGKTIVPEEILNKPGNLTKEEFESIKKHAEAGYRIASSTKDFAHVANEILSHHEHWDGTGYPEGLKGEEIPLLARIISIADAFDAMTTGRVYKEAMGVEDAMREIKEGAGSQFDPVLAEKFIKILKE